MKFLLVKACHPVERYLISEDTRWWPLQGPLSAMRRFTTSLAFLSPWACRRGSRSRHLPGCRPPGVPRCWGY